MQSARFGSLDCVRILLGRSSSSFHEYDYRANALSEAARGGHASCVAAMLESPLAPSVWTLGDLADALNDIAEMGSLECLRLLFERFPWLSDKNAKEWDQGVFEGHYFVDAARRAGMSGSIACLRELRGRQGLFGHEEFGAEALRGAASAGRLDALEWAAEHGGRIGEQDFRSALIEAAENGQAEAAVALLDRAKKNGMWGGGEDSVVLALWRAAKKGRSEVVEALMERCDPLSYESYSGMTALMVAAEAGQAECVSLLLRAGGAGLRDGKGKDALMRAAASRSLETVEALLGHCSGRWVDDAGRDALMHAAMNGRHEAVEALLPWSDPRRVDNDGATALMWAAKKGNPLCVAALLPVSDARARSSLGRTALMACAWRGDAACAKLLMEASDPQARDSHGQSASDAAKKRRFANSNLSEALKSWEDSGRERAALEAEVASDEGVARDFGAKAAKPRL